MVHKLKFRERLCEKKCFSCLLKEAREVAVVTLVGRLFHARAAITRKDWSPMVRSRILGTIKRCWDPDRSRHSDSVSSVHWRSQCPNFYHCCCCCCCCCCCYSESVFWCWQQLITAMDHRTGLESQINRLQHKVKDTNDEFKSRLQKYIKDIAVSTRTAFLDGAVLDTNRLLIDN